MALRNMVSLFAFSVLATVAIAAVTTQSAFAQTTGSNTVGISTVTSTPSTGTGVTLANITVTNPNTSSTQMTSVPFALTLGGGAAASSLSNCRLYDSNNSAITGTISPTSGTNTFNFSNTFTQNANSSSSLTLRCDVASGVPSGGSFQFGLSGSSALSGTSLGVTLNATPRIAAGTQDALMALVLLTAGTGNSIQTTSLPISTTFSGGLSANHFADCRVRNVTNLTSPLSSSIGIVSGSNTFSLTSPLTVSAGATVSLAVTCDVAHDAPVGSIATFSLTPSSLPATISGSSTTVTPIIGQALGGGTGVTAGNVTIVPAIPTPIPTIPGVPNTGFGSQVNLLILVISGMTALGAALLLRRRDA